MSVVLRLLDDLPEGVTIDGDPRVIDGEVVIPRPDRKAYAVKPDGDRCSECHGRAMVDVIVTEAGKPERVRRPCGCIWRAVQLHEAREANGSGVVKTRVCGEAKSGGTPLETRAMRLREEIAQGEARIAEWSAAQARMLAPFETRLAEAEESCKAGDAEEAAALETYGRRSQEADGRRRDVEHAQEMLRAAQAAQKDAEAAVELALKAIAEIQTRRAPNAAARQIAQEALDRARTRGHRHRLQVEQGRVAKWRERLAELEASCPSK